MGKNIYQSFQMKTVFCIVKFSVLNTPFFFSSWIKGFGLKYKSRI